MILSLSFPRLQVSFFTACAFVVFIISQRFTEWATTFELEVKQ